MKERNFDGDVCPACKAKDCLYIVKDYSDRHNRESMCECGRCDSIIIFHYKFDRVEIASNRWKVKP